MLVRIRDPLVVFLAVFVLVGVGVRIARAPEVLDNILALLVCGQGREGFCLLVGGVFDLFDGTVARRTGLASPFGAFYDSTLDRLSEIVVYLGLLSLYNDYRLELGDVGMIYTVLLAMVMCAENVDSIAR